MKRTVVPGFASLLLIGVIGCQNNAQPSAPAVPIAAAVPSQAPVLDPSPEGQIRTAIQAHLAHNSNLNLKSFDTDVKQVSIQGDHAQAQVEFRVKGGPGAMQLTYQLQKQGEGWAVVESNPDGSNFSHPGLNQGQSPNTPAAPGTAPDSLAETLRSFKQGASGPAPTLPPGHPAVQQNQ